jgi:cytochrome P450
MHRNPEAFPQPDVFDPKRWINQPAEVLRAREACFVPFSKGSRNCLGQNLAMCELYIALGTMFRRYEGFDAVNIGPLTYLDYFNIFHPDDCKPLTALKAERVKS